jgi:uncharacterized protein YbaA (DUF1428 family)
MRMGRAGRHTDETADQGDPMSEIGPYVDVHLLPVPERNLGVYELQAAAFGAVAREYGALSYREFRADDVGEGFAAGEGEVMTVAVVEFESREHRDEVMGKVIGDARVREMAAAEQPADMTRMVYGGFAPLVSV